VTWGILGHVAYFAIRVGAGGWFAARRLGKLLLT
jgi:lipooligosaccharide transport system permease protein